MDYLLDHGIRVPEDISVVAYGSEPYFAAQGVPLLGVDCETLNPPAFRCWSKRFAPFTYSFVRRLDERCALHKD